MVKKSDEVLATGRRKEVPPIAWGLAAMFVVMYVLSAL